MPSTIGPLFAMRGKLKDEWSVAPWTDTSQFILESVDGRYWALEKASPLLLEKLKGQTEETVFIVQVIREDAEVLFAFENIIERALFLEVREFDSVGPKTAGLLLSNLGVSGIKELLEKGQRPGQKIAGLGPKTMEKILIGLKQNREKFLELFSKARLAVVADSSGNTAPSLPSDGEGVPLAVLQAMEKLGLRQNDVQLLWNEMSREVKDFAKLGNVDVIRMLLQAWGKNKSRIYQGMSGEA